MIKKINLNENYRLIAISDIHGGYDHFIQLIKKSNLQDNDYLIILGDFLEKGLKSKEVLEYLKKLNKREKTYILKGNNEDFFLKCVFQENFNEVLIKYMKYKKYGSLFDFYFSKLQINMEKKNGQEIQELIKLNFKEDLDFLKKLHIGIETKDFIFVHAGIEKKDNWREDKENQLLYLDKFLEKGHNSKKTVIVGHWPCSNYRKDSLSNEIIIDKKNRIIAIDGGFGVKDEGQINALEIISDINGTIFNTYHEDLLDTYELLEDAENTQNTEKVKNNSIKIGWPNYEIELVKEGSSFSLCKILLNGQMTKVKNELIYKEEKKLYCIQDYIYKFYYGKKGDKVKLVKLFSDFCLIKKENDFYWIKTKLLNIKY